MAEDSKRIITRASVNSISVPATGRKALVLDGTTIELGDTGLRDVSGLFVAGSVTSGSVRVWRQKDVVEWQFVNIVLPSSAAGQTIMSNTAQNGILTPFLPPTGDEVSMGLVSSGDTARARVSSSGVIQMQYAEAAQAWNMSVTFVTNRAWPTTLPGVVNGQPVGV